MVSWTYSLKRGILVFFWVVVWGVLGFLIGFAISGTAIWNFLTAYVISGTGRIPTPADVWGLAGLVIAGSIVGSAIASIGTYTSMVKVVLESAGVSDKTVGDIRETNSSLMPLHSSSGASNQESKSFEKRERVYCTSCGALVPGDRGATYCDMCGNTLNGKESQD